MGKFLFAFPLLTITSCFSLRGITFSPHENFDEQTKRKSLHIQFNGVAHYYIKYNQTAVITDPFLSNPPVSNVFFGRIFCDTPLIDRFKEKPKTSDIKMVLIGHAHYDHILDLPYYLPYLGDSTSIFGSANVDSICRSLNYFNTVNAAAFAATDSMAGVWFYHRDSTVRVMAIQSAHLPHFLGIHCYKGNIKKHLAKFPDKAKDFKQDVTLAYLIDFLDEQKKPVKRMYFASSAIGFPLGFFSKHILDEKAIDVAILSIALFQHARYFPYMQIVFLKPEHTILCHWENFFRNRNQDLRPVGLTHHRQLQKHLQKLRHLTRFHFMKPGTSLVLE
jgi:L-ascorbate metabolism protein UlaG (beta-lactamase superfamily)